MLQQINSVEDQIRLQRKRLDTCKQEKQRQENYLTELTLNNKRIEKDLAQATTTKEDLLVEENILKLEIRRVRAALNERADKVYTLGQRKLQLKETMKERLDEIQVHKELLHKQLREVEGDRASINKGCRFSIIIFGVSINTCNLLNLGALYHTFVAINYIDTRIPFFVLYD